MNDESNLVPDNLLTALTEHVNNYSLELYNEINNMIPVNDDVQIKGMRQCVINATKETRPCLRDIVHRYQRATKNEPEPLPPIVDHASLFYQNIGEDYISQMKDRFMELYSDDIIDYLIVVEDDLVQVIPSSYAIKKSNRLGEDDNEQLYMNSLELCNVFINQDEHLQQQLTKYFQDVDFMNSCPTIPANIIRLYA